MNFLTLSALLLVGQLISAMPFEQVTRRNLPRDVVHIAHDEANGQYLAYKRDGSLYGKYPAQPTRDIGEHKVEEVRGPCTQLAVAEAQQLPGYHLIEEEANKNWGTEKRKIVTNPTSPADQAALGATACVGEEVVQVQLSGFQCNSNTGQVDSQARESNGTITTSVSSTYSNTGTWSVKSTSSIGVSVTVSAMFEIPPIPGVGASITTSAEFQNEVGKSFGTTNSETTTVGSTFSVPSGKECQIVYNTNSCTVPGYGKVRYEAGGWIWFQYNEKVKGHYKWAVSIEGAVKNVDDRSSFMEFVGNIQGTSNTNFTAQCKDII